MKKVIAGVLSLSLVLSTIAPSFALPLDAAVVGAGAGYAAGTYLPVAVGAPALVAPAVAATAAVPAVLAVSAVATVPAVAAVAAVPSLVTAAGATAAGAVGAIVPAVALPGVVLPGMTLNAAVAAANAARIAAGFAAITPTSAQVATQIAGGFLTSPVAAVVGSPGVAGVAGVVGSPGVAGVAGSPAVFSQARPDMLFGVSTATLIQSFAIGLGAYIIYQALTGELHPPTVSLLKEGYSKPSGKAYRYAHKA